MSITIHPSMLSDERRNDPRRRAEMSVLDQLTASDYQGTAIYEWSAGHGAQEVDAPLWIRDMGRYALQVKGGTYIIRGYNWFLRLPDGALEQKPSPVFQTWDGAMAMRRAVEDVIGFQVYIIPVLVLPDMDPDPHATALAARKHVHVVWRGEDLMARLAEIAAREVVRHPPTQAHIENEVHAMMYGEPLAPAPQVRRVATEPVASIIPAQLDGSSATVVINNYGPLVMHFGSPDDLADIVASMMPASPTNPQPHSPANARSVAEDPPAFGDVAVAAPAPLPPPTAAQS